MAPTCTYSTCQRLLSGTTGALFSAGASAPVVGKNAPALTRLLQKRHQSDLATGQLDSSRLEINPASPSQLSPKPPVNEIAWGKTFTDHMLRIHWSADKGWGVPKIQPLEPIPMHPAAKVLHYAQELFEGMKAYRGVDDQIRMFRPMHNMARLNVTAERVCLPAINGGELVECIRRLVQIDQEWVPHCTSSSLYIRPFLFGTEAALGVSPSSEADLMVILAPVGPYYATGFKPINLLADPNYVRAWPGGCGFAKMGSNYAPTLWIGKAAEKHNCHQVLWLFGQDHEITEVGAMNVFVYLDHGNGKKELVTPCLDKGIILPGVTRRSIIELTRKWGEFEVNERKITMGELVEANQSGKLIEFFGSGTAAVVSPIGGVFYEGKMHKIPVPEDSLANRILAAMSDIFYGRVAHPWAIDIENWKVDPHQFIEDFANAETAAQKKAASS